MPNAKDYAPEGSVWKHRKGGVYIVVAHGKIEADLTPCVVYRKDGAADVWVRPAHEFLDGRFTPVTATI